MTGTDDLRLWKVLWAERILNQRIDGWRRQEYPSNSDRTGESETAGRASHPAGNGSGKVSSGQRGSSGRRSSSGRIIPADGDGGTAEQGFGKSQDQSEKWKTGWRRIPAETRQAGWRIPASSPTWQSSGISSGCQCRNKVRWTSLTSSPTLRTRKPYCFFYASVTRGLYHKTCYSRNLQISVIS